jgi:hypothetical protein
VAVAAGERPRQRDPAALDEEVVLGAVSGSINRARARRGAPFSLARDWHPRPLATTRSGPRRANVQAEPRVAAPRHPPSDRGSDGDAGAGSRRRRHSSTHRPSYGTWSRSIRRKGGGRSRSCRPADEQAVGRRGVGQRRRCPETVKVLIVKPRGADETPPVVLYIHGGGWVFGSARTHDRLVRELAVGARAAIVFPEYSLSPEAPYPAALQQRYAVATALKLHQTSRPRSLGQGARRRTLRRATALLPRHRRSLRHALLRSIRRRLSLVILTE